MSNLKENIERIIRLAQIVTEPKTVEFYSKALDILAEDIDLAVSASDSLYYSVNGFPSDFPRSYYDYFINLTEELSEKDRRFLEEEYFDEPKQIPVTDKETL